MKGTRKKYDAKFKAKVALETIKERETLNELLDGHNASVPSQAFEQAWKRILHQTIPAQGLGY